MVWIIYQNKPANTNLNFNYLMRFSILTYLFVAVVFSSNAQNDWSNVKVLGNSVGFEKVNKADLKKIFLGNVSNWSNKVNTIIVLPSTRYSRADELTKTVMEKSHNLTRRFWLGLVFQGRANPPIYLDNNQKIIDYINANEGAIAVIIDNEQRQLKNELIIE